MSLGWAWLPYLHTARQSFSGFQRACWFPTQARWQQERTDTSTVENYSGNHWELLRACFPRGLCLYFISYVRLSLKSKHSDPCFNSNSLWLPNALGCSWWFCFLSDNCHCLMRQGSSLYLQRAVEISENRNVLSTVSFRALSLSSITSHSTREPCHTGNFRIFY